MRILVTADIHYSLKQFDWLYRVAADYDLVIIAGDHLDIASTVDARAQIAVVLNTLKRLASKTRILINSGNHDLDARDRSGEKYAAWLARLREEGIPVDGDSVVIEGMLFSICAWWDGPAAMERVASHLAKDASATKKQWIWIYHAPPAGSPTSRDPFRSYGDEQLRHWIEEYEPDLVVCGHVHNAPFHSDGAWIDRIGCTWVINSGKQIGDEPAHIVLDTGAQSALWFSLAGAEIARLDKEVEPYSQKLRELPDWF